MRLHFTIVSHDRRRTSRCRQILFDDMYIDAPESTTNSLSSGLRVDGAGRHQFSEGEKNAVLFISLFLGIFLASFHAASRAHRSCHSVSS